MVVGVGRMVIYMMGPVGNKSDANRTCKLNGENISYNFLLFLEFIYI